MILLKLVPLGDSPTITFTTAAPVQPGQLHPDDDPAYAGPSRRQSYDSLLGSFRAFFSPGEWYSSPQEA